MTIDEIRARWADYKEPWRFEVRPNEHSMWLGCRGNILFDVVRWGMSSAQLRFNVAGLMIKAKELLELFPNEEHHPWRKWIKHPVAQCIESAPTDIAYLLDKVERLDAWIKDLQSGMYINCVYCGHRYGPEKDTPVAMADVLKAHIEQCTNHPMSALKAEVERLTAENARLRAELEDGR